MKCPKCEYERRPSDHAPDYECPDCGIVYAKYEPKRRISHQAVHAQDVMSNTSTPSASASAVSGLEPSRGRSSKRVAMILVGVLGVGAVAWALSSGHVAPRSATSVASSVTISSAPHVAVKSCRSLTGAEYEALSNDYITAHPNHAAMVREYWKTGRVDVGMPEAAFAVVGCFWIEAVNVTETASGVRTQVVISREFPTLGRYIYIENGVISAIQRES